MGEASVTTGNNCARNQRGWSRNRVDGTE